MRIIDYIKNWLKPKPNELIMSDKAIKEIEELSKYFIRIPKQDQNILFINNLGLNQKSFKSAVYDYVALHDSFNFDKFIEWLNE